MGKGGPNLFIVARAKFRRAHPVGPRHGRWAIMRMLTSVGPPAGNGTTILIAWVGNGTERSACAMAGSMLSPVASIRKAAARMDRMLIVPLRAMAASNRLAGRLNLFSLVFGGKRGVVPFLQRDRAKLPHPTSLRQRYALCTLPGDGSKTVRDKIQPIAQAPIRPYHPLRKAQP